LAVHSITQTNSAINAKAINNEGRILTYSNSQINIKNIDDGGITNAGANAYFRVKGDLTIKTVSGTPIANLELFVNSNEFINYENGEINMDSDIYAGFSNSSTEPIFHNYGYLKSENVTIGLINQGEVNNYSTGIMEFENNTGTGIENRIDATITNDGMLEANFSESGLMNLGTIINNENILIFDADINSSIVNLETGIIENYYSIYLGSHGYRDIYNEGSIINHSGSYFSINQIIDLTTTGSITNYGFFMAYGSNSHSINGDFINEGVIDDDFGHLVNKITNNSLVVSRATDPMQVNVPYSNVLDVSSLANVSIGDWKTTQTGNSAGTYDELTNEFTPNGLATGVDKLYISITDLISGDTRNFSLEIDSPILPFLGKKSISSTRNSDTNEYANEKETDVLAYPNPSSGKIQLESDSFKYFHTEIQVFNSLGQMVQYESLNPGAISHSLEFSDQLINGLYYVKTIQDGNELSTHRIQIHK